MTSILSFIVAIAILVVFHELGHYWVARLCDVKVLRFSVGFGRVLYAKRWGRGETEWVVSAIPLGGYVKMLDEREGEVAEAELPRAFNRKPVLQRMAIVVAGPLANLLLAIVLYFALFSTGVPGVKPVLGMIPDQTAAAVAGLQARDTIIAINGEPVSSWQDVRWSLLEVALQKQSAQLILQTPSGASISRMLEMHKLTADDLDGDFLIKLGLQLYQPPIYPVIDQVLEQGAAEAGGLRTGDKILRVNGLPMMLWDDFVEVVRAHPGHELEFEIERDGKVKSLSVTPRPFDEGGVTVGRIGAAPYIDKAVYDAMLTEVRYPPFQALQEAVKKTVSTSLISLKMMGKMLVGEVSLKNLSGPITIADYAGQTAQIGLSAYIGFLALVSISLGVLNLLPIPLLDGGHLLYYSAELIKGSPVDEWVWEAGQKAGIALLVTMMTFALYNDISRLILE